MPQASARPPCLAGSHKACQPTRHRARGLDLFTATFYAVVTTTGLDIGFFRKSNNPVTTIAPGRFKFWWIFQLHKIEFIRRKINVHFRFAVISAFGTFTPVRTFVPFVKMSGAHGITAMISGAAVASVRKHLVIIIIITNPVAAAICLHQFLCSRTANAAFFYFAIGFQQTQSGH